MTIRRTVVFGLRTEPGTIVERLQSLPDIRQQLRLEVTPGNVWVAIVDRPRVFPVPVYTVQRGGVKQGREAKRGGEATTTTTTKSATTRRSRMPRSYSRSSDCRVSYNKKE